jgi:hypothetical protein
MTLTQTRLGRKLARPLRLSAHSSQLIDPVAPIEAHSAEIEFVAYAADCILSGRLALRADRLSDLLNAHDRVQLVDVLVTDLVGGAPTQLHELLVERDELLLLHATGPRGRIDQRRRTRQVPIRATVGPYLVRGFMHALPGADAIASLRLGRPIIALTDALVTYPVAGVMQRRQVGTLLLNWTLAESIAEDMPATAPDALHPLDDHLPYASASNGVSPREHAAT